MRIRLHLLLALTAAALSACGGGGGGPASGPVTTASATSASGTMTRTAAATISVNGNTFDISSATVRIDDRVASSGELHDGMRVRVKGTDDGAGHRRANEVEAENEVRGMVTSVSAGSSPPFFDIGNVKVLVDSATVYVNLSPADFSAIQPNVFVEVSGSRDASGNVLATRVEGKGARNPAAPEVDELHGLIDTVGANQFAIGAVAVTYTATTTFTPPTRCTAVSLAKGLRVEAHGAFTGPGTFAATRIDCEDLEDASRSPDRGEQDSLEGLIAALDTNQHTFTIDGRKVSYSSATEFRNGTEADLALDVQVEVEGTFDGTTLVAREIEFERIRIVLAGIASAVGTNSVTVLDRTVRVNDATEIRSIPAAGGSSTTLADISPAVDRIEVRARLENGGLVAERITEINNTSGGGKDVVQAPVVTKNEQTLTLGLLDAGNPILVALTGAQMQATDGTVISAAAFFAQVTAATGSNAGTLVKANGRFNGSTFAVEEIELEH
jgi:hypothetical protein